MGIACGNPSMSRKQVPMMQNVTQSQHEQAIEYLENIRSKNRRSLQEPVMFGFSKQFQRTTDQSQKSQ